MRPAQEIAASCGDFPSVDEFEAGTVQPETFNHRAHVYVAWCYLQRCGLAEAAQRYTAALRRLTRKLGVPGKYNETISWFFLVIIAEKIAASPAASWQQFSSTHPDLCEDGGGMLGRYYSKSRLHSDAARRSFLLPDKQP